MVQQVPRKIEKQYFLLGPKIFHVNSISIVVLHFRKLKSESIPDYLCHARIPYGNYYMTVTKERAFLVNKFRSKRFVSAVKFDMEKKAFSIQHLIEIPSTQYSFGLRLVNEVLMILDPRELLIFSIKPCHHETQLCRMTTIQIPTEISTHSSEFNEINDNGEMAFIQTRYHADHTMFELIKANVKTGALTVISLYETMPDSIKQLCLVEDEDGVSLKHTR
jgi:hypothetical protein